MKILKFILYAALKDGIQVVTINEIQRKIIVHATANTTIQILLLK